jgi:RNA polymerase subunit RPABC4/transcription elongation factor Spt4
MSGRTVKLRSLAIVIVALLVAGSMLSISYAPSNQKGAIFNSPRSLIAHDVIIGGGFGLSTWSLSGGTQYLQGNLTIMAGGVVTLNNESLVFDDFASQNNYASYEAAPLYHIIIEDGGELIMHHSVITTNLQLINDIPVLGLYLQHNASLVMEQGSQLIFPGQFVSEDSNVTLVDSSIAGPSPSSFTTSFINETVFPPGIFANPPVTAFFGGNVLIVNSTVSIFENNSSANTDMNQLFTENYPFASDTVFKNYVTYTLEALPTSVYHGNPLADTTKNQVLSNLTSFDQLYYEIQSGQRLSVTNFSTAGITGTLSSVQLAVAYETQLSGSGTLYWTYGNMSVPQGSFALPSSSSWSNLSFNIPITSANDLSRLLVWINDSTGNILVNKLWFTFETTYDAYNNLTIAGSSSFTAINSYIGANFDPVWQKHSSISVADTAHAYLYDVRVNSAMNYTGVIAPAMIGDTASMNAKPLSLGPLNTPVSGDQLPLLDANTAKYYAVPAGGALQTYGMNVTNSATLNSMISSATLYLTSNSSTGNMIYVGEIGQPVTSYVATGVRITGQSLIYKVNLYDLGFSNFSEIANLVLYISNSGDTSPVYVKNVHVQLTILPQIYIYRFANITVLSKQGLPVQGSAITLSYSGSTPNNITQGSRAGYFVGPSNNYQLTPPSQVLSYLGKTAGDYSITGQFGNAIIPLMTDVIYASVYPDSLYVGNYTADIQYNGSSYGSSVSFSPFPQLSAASQFVDFNVTISVLVPLPVISVSRPVISPTFLYAGQQGTVSFTIADTGSTGVSNMPVNISDAAAGMLISFKYISVSIAPKSQVNISLPWSFSAPYNNTISVLANPNRSVPEPYYGGDYNSTIYFVEPNLPELVVSSSGIVFNPAPAFTGRQVLISASIQNFMGRANATNVSVAFYAGNPLSGGSLIGTRMLNISAGGANTTSLYWSPNIIGSIPIYVYIDPLHVIAQYSRSGNLNYSILEVELTPGVQDLVINNSNSGPSDPFIINTVLNMSSNVVVTQSGYLLLSGGFSFVEGTPYQFAMVVNDSAKLVLNHATISSDFELNLFVYGNSHVYINSSSLGADVNLVTGNSAGIWIYASSINGSVVTAPFSSALISAYNSSFAHALTFGYSETAMLYNIAAPSVSAQSVARAYIYRWITVEVLGPSMVTIAQANVTLYSFANAEYLQGSVYAKGETNSNGLVTFAALSDMINESADLYIGNYFVNASFLNEKVWYAPEADVSLAHYTSPLLQQNVNVSMQLVIKLPELVITPSDINVLQTPIVEGSNVTVSALIFNLGYAPVTQNFTVTFFLPGMGEVNVTTALTAPLGVGQAVPVEVVWSVPMKYGNMTINVYVNKAKTLPEASYTDGFASINVTVLSLPELVPVTMNVTGSFQEDTNLTFSVLITNYGQTDAGQFTVTILEGNSPTNVTTPVANATLKGLDAFGSLVAEITWTVPPLPAGVRTERVYFTAAVDMNHSVKEASYSRSVLIQPIAVNLTIAQVNATVSISSNTLKSGTVMVVTVDVVSRVTGKGMPDYPVTIMLYNIRGQPQSAITFQGTTGSNGLLVARIPIPVSQKSGTYLFNVYSDGNFISSSQSFSIVSPSSSTGFPLLYLFVIIAGVIAAFGGFSFYLYRYGLSRVVECGNCGAFIPETSKKCPYCGVEFEAGTAKCSNCNSWIPANSKQCPICGVKFADEGEGEQEDEYTAKMRKEYSEFVEKFKAQAKAEMGKKYSEKAFLTWWKRQPTYLSFEDWLSRQQSIRKAKLVPCPVCGEPNPESAKECMKCGSPMSQAAKEQPPRAPPAQPPAQQLQEQKTQVEPRRIVVPKKIIRKVEEKQPPAQPEQPVQKDEAKKEDQ